MLSLALVSGQSPTYGDFFSTLAISLSSWVHALHLLASFSFASVRLFVQLNVFNLGPSFISFFHHNKCGENFTPPLFIVLIYRNTNYQTTPEPRTYFKLIFHHRVQHSHFSSTCQHLTQKNHQPSSLCKLTGILLLACIDLLLD